ncbi:WcaI family glycosyltransferase [Futiania mangrovi]|uniref:WcaI family glycosyltransferase n=1 Tax=Futiania mangrovi TaxID=2959716 RepID=A0A9J6PH00_9PROT|nr:WcaI family glycosyltransferase [Futiania mangrovii]MCP1335370.1 WcaI family glycosyltransferase [Futiania mangrovii]
MRRLKLLVHGVNYPPDMLGIAKYTGEMCAWLAARGHEVAVVTAPPHYPAWKVPDGWPKGWHEEWRDGVRTIRCPVHVPGRPGAAGRLLHQASFAGASARPLLRAARCMRPDAVMGIAPATLPVPLVRLAARTSGAASWLHVQDLEADAALGLGMLPLWLGRAARAGERWLLTGFDRVSAITPPMADRLAAKGVARDRLSLFGNWVDTATIRPDVDGGAFRAAWGARAGTVVALYAGSMGEKQGLGVLAEAARVLKDRGEVLFVLAGAGAGRAALEDAVEGLQNVRMTGPVAEADLPALLAAADLHLLPQRAGAADLLLPSKLAGMLASGRPVVAGAAPGTSLAAEVEGAGLCVAPEDGEALARAVADLAGDAERRRTLGAAARARACARWDRETVLGGLERELTALADARDLSR